MSSQTLNFGLLLLPEFQLLDATGPVDFLDSHSHPHVSAIPDVPKEILDKACHIKWHYISTDMTPVYATSGPGLIPTCTYADCPPLEYLIVPGPDSRAPLPDGCAAFLQNLFAHPEFKAILLICTGAIAVAQAGVLDGHKACSNKVSLKALAQAGLLNKKVTWIGDRRWIIDGKVWSSAGVTSGLDLAAEFARIHFDPEVVALVKDAIEYEANPAQPDAFARILDGVDLS